MILFIKESRNNKLKFSLGIIISMIISYIFFPISGYTLYDYWIVVTNSGESFDFALSISRIIRFNHMIWLSPSIFSTLYAFFLNRNSLNVSDITSNYPLKKKYFGFSIFISIIAEIILGIIGLIAYLSYLQ